MAYRFSVAPMMDWTDRHCRSFHRSLSRHALLYTEMVTTGAVLHGKREYLLGYHPAQHPVALQLGGCDPAELAECARVGAEWGYDEINLNVGCPSDRVQSGRFGACLMAEPELVAACVAAMRAAVAVPVTVKTRIGIDDRDSYEELRRFVSLSAEAGCSALILHARKAWLKGLSPRENREIPPLRYDVARRLKADFPGLPVILNGGIADLDQAEAHVRDFDGVMLGRAAYENPYLLAQVDARFHGVTAPIPNRRQAVEAFYPYIEAELARGTWLSRITRHMLGLYQGVPGARAWRRHLSEKAVRPGAGLEVVAEALDLAEGRMERRARAPQPSPATHTHA